MASLQGKVIAITGGASGIGLAVAKECAARGASLALADVQDELLQKAVAEFEEAGVKAMGTKVDVSDSNSVNTWIDAVIQQMGRLDGAANMAGVERGKDGGVFTDITELSDAHWDFIIGINLTGVFYCLRAELKVMQEGGSIVNASSIAGLMGRSGLGAYSSSKHGVVGLTKTAAKEVGKRGIRVNAIAPGPVLTPMLERLLAEGSNKTEGAAVTNTYKNLPMQRLGKPEEIAKTVCFLLSDDSGWTTGVAFPVDGGATC